MIVWIGALQIMLDQGEDLDWFNSPIIVCLLITTIIGFVSFLIWELTAADPIVNLRVFANRGYAIGSIVMCLCFGSYFAAVVIIPLWLQTNLGYTATWAPRPWPCGAASPPTSISPRSLRHNSPKACSCRCSSCRCLRSRLAR
jgi:hypothetical protein